MKAYPASISVRKSRASYSVWGGDMQIGCFIAPVCNEIKCEKVLDISAISII